MPRPSAFLPNPANGETSVFRFENNDRSKLRKRADAHIGSNRTIKGAAIVLAAVVRSTGLTINATEPPPAHADIVDWPPLGEDQRLWKAQCKEKAGVIASQAGLVQWE